MEKFDIFAKNIEAMANENEAPFVFGVRVEGDTFTDRKEETKRLKMNFLLLLSAKS